MGKRLIAAVLVGLIALGAGQVALAYGPGARIGAEDMGRGMMGWRASDELGLTSEQQKQLTELQVKHLEKTQGLHMGQEKLRLELRNLWSEDPLDAEAIAAKEGELTKARIQLMEIRRELQKEAEGVFTAEQLESLKTRPWGQMGQRECFGGYGRRMGRGQRGCMGGTRY